MIGVKITTDMSGLSKKKAKVQKEFKRLGNDTVYELAQKGREYAKFKAPEYSGKTMDLIELRKSPVKGRTVINAKNPTAKRSDGFNLVKWMHKTNGIGKPSFVGSDGNWYTRRSGIRDRKIRSGNPRFMYTTRRYLNGIKKKFAKGKFNKINI